MDQFNQIVRRVDIKNRTWYNWDEVNGIAMEIDFCSIFIVVAFITDTTIKLSILISSLDLLTIIFDEIAPRVHVDKPSEFECDCENNCHATINTKNVYKIRVTPLAVRFALDVFHLIMQAMDTLSIYLTVSIEFEAAIVIGQLMLYFAVSSSNNAVSRFTSLIHNVCTVISYLLPFVCNI